jgi:chromosome partitioning protein
MSENSDESIYTASQIAKIFRVEQTKQTILNLEEKGIIPTAKRVLRGKTPYRVWSTNQLPEIGEAIGYLKKPTKPRVFSVFSLKGGTGKSSFAFQLARTLALHKINTLVIGLDAQESITQTIKKSSQSLENEGMFEVNGLYQFLTEKISIDDVIQGTDLPTLSYIPETIELSVLDVWLNQQTRKEYLFREKIVNPLLKKNIYDIIIFDCNPAWNSVVTSALAASSTLISPLGADINSLKAARIFTDLLAHFQEDMNHSFESFFIVPTMVEANKLSNAILSKYRLEYESLCSTGSIKRAVVVQESNVKGKSLAETAYDAQVYEDFISVFQEIINQKQEAHPTKSGKEKQQIDFEVELEANL